MIAFYRGYSSRTNKRAGQVTRLHILRPDLVGNPPNRTEQALCGVHAWNVTDSPRVEIDPMPAVPPDGLTWCPKCIGCAAERTGHLLGFALILSMAGVA